MKNILPIVTLVSAVLTIALTVLKIIATVLGIPSGVLKKALAPIFKPWVAWTLLAIVSVLSLILVLTRPVIPLNRLITYYDFEGVDDGWSRTDSIKFASDGIATESQLSRDDFFPGSMTSEVTTDYALTGQGSLKVTTSVSVAGDFKSFLYRKGSVTGNGVTIYVLAPDLTDVYLAYVQLCVPSHDWVCSNGTDLVLGEWTPITIDLSQYDNDDVALYEQKLTELAIQWRFETEHGALLELYFDSAEIFHSGP